MMERERLAHDLKQIVENDYLIPDGMELSQYVGPMIQYIGDIDPILRNDLVYSTLIITRWIESLSECCEFDQSRSRYITRVNTKNFIRSLNFKLIHHESDNNLMETLVIVEKLLNRSLIYDRYI